MDAARDFGGSMPEYYDRIMGPAHFDRFADDLVRRMPASPSGDVLELACGTGIVSRWLRARVEPTLRVVATDSSEPMLDYARAKVRGAIDWRVADAQALPFADGEFGAVVCAFGVMFFPDKERAFREARRVLRKGGLLLFNVWDGLDNNPHGAVADEVMRGLFPDEQEPRFSTMPYEFNDRARIAAMLKEAGFAKPRIDAVRLQCGAASARELATGQLRGTPRGNLLAARGVSVETVIERLTQALARVGSGEPFVYPAQALVVETRAA